MCVPVYRLNTYPLIHIGFIHAFLNIIALVPLLERFEADHGTLLTAAFFVGRELHQMPFTFANAESSFIALSTLPAAAYLLIERVILRGNTPVMGARFVL